MYGRSPGMGTYPPRGTLALCTIPSQPAIGHWGLCLLTVWGGIDSGEHRFRRRVVGDVGVLKLFLSDDGTLISPEAARPRRWREGESLPRAGFTSPSPSATSQWGWSFHTVRGGIDPGDLYFRPPFVGVVEI